LPEAEDAHATDGALSFVRRNAARARQRTSKPPCDARLCVDTGLNLEDAAWFKCTDVTLTLMRCAATV
jgi:hypothetical protein